MKSVRSVLMLLAGLALAACQPDMYEAGEGDADGNTASFAFAVEHCHDGKEGRFTLVDPNWDIPVDMQGRVVNFIEADEPGDCMFYAHLEYTSNDKDHPGSGKAQACFGGDDPIDHVHVTVETGPFAGYSDSGAIEGVIEPQTCLEAF